MTQNQSRKPRLSDTIGNFVAVPQTFVDDASISHEAFRLFVVLRSYTSARSDEQVAFPDYPTLRARTGIGANKTIASRLRELEAAGWIERRKRFGQSTIYTLISPSRGDGLTDATVRHAVTCSPSRGDVQSVTPAKANKRYSTRSTQLELQQAPAPASVVVSIPPDADTTDATMDAPAVRTLFNLTRIPLTFGQRNLIVNAITDIPRWREVVEYWIGRSWSAANIVGMIDLYNNWQARKQVYTPAPSTRSQSGPVVRRGTRSQVQYTDEMRAQKEREAAARRAARRAATGASS